jgi:tetratricopeptide (TPR) repeat protein
MHDLDREVRGRLRTLSKDSADRVAKHLVMVGRLLDDDPELAYEHAQAAVRRGGRVDVVREAAGLAAYRTGRYAEALRELRTVRRLNGSPEHLPVLADAERGLGRPERALTVAADPDVARLPAESQVELAMVVSGARLDLGQPDAALAALDAPVVRAARGLLAARVAQARATALDAAGRAPDAERELAAFDPIELDLAAGGGEDDDEIAVFDLLDDEHVDDEADGVDGDDESGDDESDEADA